MLCFQMHISGTSSENIQMSSCGAAFAVNRANIFLIGVIIWDMLLKLQRWTLIQQNCLKGSLVVLQTVVNHSLSQPHCCMYYSVCGVVSGCDVLDARRDVTVCKLSAEDLRHRAWTGTRGARNIVPLFKALHWATARPMKCWLKAGTSCTHYTSSFDCF